MFASPFFGAIKSQVCPKLGLPGNLTDNKSWSFTTSLRGAQCHHLESTSSPIMSQDLSHTHNTTIRSTPVLCLHQHVPIIPISHPKNFTNNSLQHNKLSWGNVLHTQFIQCHPYV
jgi:hypothetical protein